MVLGNLANAYGRLGRYADAKTQIRAAIALDEQLNAHQLRMDHQYTLGVLHLRGDNASAALECFTEALDLANSLADEVSHRLAEEGCATACLALGRTDDAAQHARAVLASTGRDPSAAATFLNELAGRTDADWFTSRP